MSARVIRSPTKNVLWRRCLFSAFRADLISSLARSAACNNNKNFLGYLLQTWLETATKTCIRDKANKITVDHKRCQKLIYASIHHLTQFYCFYSDKSGKSLPVCSMARSPELETPMCRMLEVSLSQRIPTIEVQELLVQGYFPAVVCWKHDRQWHCSLLVGASHHWTQKLVP